MQYPDDFVNKIICGHYKDVITQIPNESIDLVFTDPPYGINKKKIVGDENFDLFHESIGECYRVLKNNCFYLTFISPGKFKEIFHDNPFTYRWTAILYFNNGVVHGGLGYSLYQSCMVFQKGDAKIKKRQSDVMEISTSTKLCKERLHPYEKYVPFIKKLLNTTTKKGDIVLDPFLGSGSTAVACKELGRNFIGIEIDSEYCRIAEDKLKKTKKDSQQITF